MSAISRIVLNWEGQEIKDFSSFTEKGVKHGERVPLMHGSTYVDITPEYGFDLEYVAPKEGVEFDFLQTKTTPATVTIYYQGGRKRTYRGVQILEEGDAAADGRTARKQTKSFMATDRDPK